MELPAGIDEARAQKKYKAKWYQREIVCACIHMLPMFQTMQDSVHAQCMVNCRILHLTQLQPALHPMMLQVMLANRMLILPQAHHVGQGRAAIANACPVNTERALRSTLDLVALDRLPKETGQRVHAQGMLSLR